MAVSYPIPAHLSPQATGMWGSQYSTGVQQGLATAQLVQQGIRQAQAARQAQAELEIRARQFEAQQEAREREALRREQQLAVEAAYKEAVVGLRERQLENEARNERAKIEEAANRSSAMIKIAQQNADTMRMRAKALSAEKQPSQIDIFTSPSGRKFVRVVNPNTGATQLHPEETGAGPTITKRTEYPKVPEVTARPGYKWWPASLLPAREAVPEKPAYTVTERIRGTNIPPSTMTPAATTTTNAATASPRFRWVNGALEPITASGKEDEAVVDESEIEEEEMPVGDEEE